MTTPASGTYILERYLSVFACVWSFVLGLFSPAAAAEPTEALTSTPRHRALAYLAREVPRWSKENGCYSCHNNGDGARVLYAASGKGHLIPNAALEDTTRWLRQPGTWDDNGGKGPFSDKQLADLQFAAALGAAVEAGHVRERSALTQAASRLVEHQQADGSWRFNIGQPVGSPTTYPDGVATVLARQTLAQADSVRFRQSISRADQWIRQQQPQNIPAAAAVLLALADCKQPDDRLHIERALGVLRKGQSPDGGWGPYIAAPPEPFDTALALLALARLPETHTVASMRKRGRSFLITTQLTDGSWPETTRPPDGDSYAQRMSTTAWATLALLSAGEK